MQPSSYRDMLLFGHLFYELVTPQDLSSSSDQDKALEIMLSHIAFILISLTQDLFDDSVWIGGSILASLGSFQQMWFSKAE